MAILNSITIGKGRKSLGNVTLQTLGGVVVAKQKIMHNKSKSVKQQTQRKHFKAVMNQLRKFAPLARAAYARVKTQSAYARWAKSFYPAAAALTPAQLLTANPASMAKDRIAAGEEFMIADGKKVFSAAIEAQGPEQEELIIFDLTSELPGSVPFGVGDTIPVESVCYDSAQEALVRYSAEVIVGSQPPVAANQIDVWIEEGVLKVRAKGILNAGELVQYPVFSINNERIGLPASLLAFAA